MNRRPQLPDDIVDQIEKLRAQARESYQAQDRKGFAAHIEQAWALIPDPKENWDYYPETLTRSLVRVYLELGNVAAVRTWIDRAYLVYDDAKRENLFVLMLEGDALYRLERRDEAYDVFSRVFDLFGRDGFKGEHLDYLEFFLKERARRDG